MFGTFQEFLSFGFPATLRAVNYMFPVPCPFFTPSKRFLANGADFAGTLRWFFATTKTLGLICHNAILARDSNLNMMPVHCFLNQPFLIAFAHASSGFLA
jgi:hypothetical protein